MNASSQRWIIMSLIGLIMITGLTFLLLPRRPSINPSPKPINFVRHSPSPSPTPKPTPSATSSQTPSPTLSPTPSPSPEASPSEKVFYPAKDYLARITNRGYGKLIAVKDKDILPCGNPFEGLHTGDDLEVFDEELTVPINIYAIADGTVKQAQTVGGYGGLIVISHKINDQLVTAYYGHLNLTKSTVKEGDKVKAGQLISVLGDHCSEQTNQERKHLHFAIHQGTDLDVRGYVPTSNDLSLWLNPQDLLVELKALAPI